MNQKLGAIFGLDIRSLATFRVGLGLLLLVDLANRATDMVAHYTDFGVMSRESMRKFYGDAWRWSLHGISGDLEWQVASGGLAWQIALFSVAAVCGVCLLLGYWTRLATVVSWLLLVSIQTRMPLINNAGDALFRMLLFWSMFLPLGAVWSIDAWRGRKRDRLSFRAPTNLNGSTNSVFSAGSVAIILQICIMYWASGWFKWNESWLSGNAMGEILAFDSYARPLASQCLEYPTLLKWASWSTLAIELVGPLLLLSPWRTQAMRLLVIAMFAGLHVGIELTLTVGLFSWVSLLAWSVLLPGSVWDFLARFLGKRAASGQGESASDGEENVDEISTGRAETPGVVSWKRKAAFACQTIAGVLLVYVVVWNTLTLLPKSKDPSKQRETPKPLARIRQLFVLHQKWSMFQKPSGYDGWYVILARLEDGRNVDLLRGGAEADWNSWDKPESIIRQSKNHRWRKYRRGLRIKKNANRRRAYCEYLVRQWDAEHPEGPRINRLELCYMQESDSEELTSQRTLYVLRLNNVKAPEYLRFPESPQSNDKTRQEPESGDL